jgi:uncharacterized protein (TIGR03437 family)
MSGITGIWQLTGIQSGQTFTPPFTVTATVMGTVANGNAFLIDLISANVKQNIQVTGNLNPNNIGASHYYGIDIFGSGGSPVLYATPSVNVQYTVVLTIGTTGKANIELFSGGTLLAFLDGLSIGTGPFYLVLGQFEGQSYTVGPNTAVWSSVEVDALSPPSVSPRGVISAGGFGGFSSATPGSWIEIYGSGLGPDSRSWGALDFNGIHAPTSLDTTSVTIGGKQAFVDYINPTQINAQVPYDVPIGPQQLIVMSPSGTSPPYTMTINQTEPGLLAPAAFSIAGNQYVVAIFPDEITYVLPPGAISGVPSRRANPGDTVTFYGIGFGPVTPAISAGQIVEQSNTLVDSLQIYFGGVPAVVAYSGLAPAYIGLYQFNVVVPNVPQSDLLPLTFTLGGIGGTQTLYIAIGQ